MIVVDKNTTPLDWLKFELEQQQQHLQAMQAVYADKYVKGKKQRTRMARALKTEIYRQQGQIIGLEAALNIFEPIPF